MRQSFRLFLLVVLAFCTLSATAQTPAVLQSGYFGYFTNTSVASAMKSDGIKIRVASYTTDQGFSVVSGSLDMATGNGEVNSAGDVTFISGAMRMDLRDIQFLSMGANSVVTAAVYQNSAYLGRQAVMTCTSSPFMAMTTYGQIQTTNVYTTYTQTFVNEFVKFFQTPDLKSTLNASNTGFVNFNVVTQAAPGFGQ